jgi:hypothetical protein
MLIDYNSQRNFALKYFGKPLYELNQNDVEDFILKQIEENLTLEYKGIESLETRAEIGKEISAFSNSSGGILLIGIEEKKTADGRSKIPVAVQWNIVKKKDKEWFSQVILANIQPHVNHIDVVSITANDGLGNIFIVDVPASAYSPHMSCIDDHQYYERIGARSEPMEHYQVDYHFGRRLRPDLIPQLFIEPVSSGIPIIKMKFKVRNDGRALAKWPFFKVEFFGCKISEKYVENKVSDRFIYLNSSSRPFIQFTSPEIAIYSGVTLDVFYVYPLEIEERIVIVFNICGEEVVSNRYITFIYLPQLMVQLKTKPGAIEAPIIQIEDIDKIFDTIEKIAPVQFEGELEVNGRPKRGYFWLLHRILFPDKTDDEVDEYIKEKIERNKNIPDE